MATIDADMQHIIDSARLGFVATVCPDGRPNLSPKGSLAVWDDEHLCFANIASPVTIENLAHDPRIDVNVVFFLARRGYRFKGTAEVSDSGPVFERVAETLRVNEGPQYPCHQGILVKVEEIAPIVSPAYTFNDHIDEPMVLDVFRKRYELGTSAEAAELEAYKEVVQQMLGFRTREEMDDVFGRPLVWDAVKQLGQALRATREAGQKDEYALALAIEQEIIGRLPDAESDLLPLFNDPEHRSMPADQLAQQIVSLWGDETTND
jgi:predicted pyridoxine 5'-phosphate oxidase superfamily flavin-nucleotide-binding protein